MKLQKIKRVCMAEKVALIETPERPEGELCNLVDQWVGIPGALYAVEGIRVTPEVLAAVWDLTDKQVDSTEWREDASEDWLLMLPSQIDEDAPVLGMVEIAGYCFFRQQQDDTLKLPAIGIKREYLVPVLAEDGRHQYLVQPDETGDPWLICYIDGKLCAAIRGGSDVAMQGCVRAASELATQGVRVLSDKG